MPTGMGARKRASADGAAVERCRMSGWSAGPSDTDRAGLTLSGLTQVWPPAALSRSARESSTSDALHRSPSRTLSERLAPCLLCRSSSTARFIHTKGSIMRSLRSLSALLLALVACSHAQPPPSPPPAQAIAVPAPPPPAPAPAPEPVAARPPPEVAPASIYFDYDASELSPASRAVLQDFLDQARSRPDQSVRIEGNCDERGSREYNLALGQRRAEAARKYLENLGMDTSRITTVSNGKERPRTSGSDEAAWNENRRDDLIPTSGNVGVSSAAEPASR